MNLRVDTQSPVPVQPATQRSDESEFLATLSAAASAQTISSPNDAADPLSALLGQVFMTVRGRPWMKIQDAAREQGIHLSKKEAIRLAQRPGQQKADEMKEGEEVEENDEGLKSDFSIISIARAKSFIFEPIANDVEHLFDNARYSLTSTARAIIRSASTLSGKTIGAAGGVVGLGLPPQIQQ